MTPENQNTQSLSNQNGYLNIFHRDGEYHLEMHVGVQSFEFEYANDDYDLVAWYADQIISAITKIGGNCRRHKKYSAEDEHA